MRPNNRPRCVRFGPYEADFHTQELRKHGMKLKLSGQPLQILEMLLARPGELVTREELQKQLWTDDVYVDSNHGLNAAVNKLRDALSDSAEEPKYIETLPRRGYRFIGTIQSERRRRRNQPVIPVTAAVSDSIRSRERGKTACAELRPNTLRMLRLRLRHGEAGPSAGCCLRARRCCLLECQSPCS